MRELLVRRIDANQPLLQLVGGLKEKASSNVAQPDKRERATVHARAWIILYLMFFRVPVEEGLPEDDAYRVCARNFFVSCASRSWRA